MDRLTKSERVRGFEVIEGYSVPIPTRSTRGSAGYDFISPESVTINPGGTAFLKTGVKAYMGSGEVLLIFIRSSLGRKGLELMNKVAVIDSDFYNNPDNEGNITLMLKNTGDFEQIVIKEGDKVAQGLFVPYLLVDGDDFKSHSVQRTGGIGSTGE